MRVLLLKSLSAYDATRTFIDRVAAAFAAAGHEASICDVAEDDDVAGAILAFAADKAFDLIFSIGVFGELRDDQGRSLSQMIGAPHVVQHVDYPLSHYPKLNGTPPDTALLVVDPTHVDAVRSVYGDERFSFVGFSPHGSVLDDPAPLPSDPAAFLAQRPIPVLFSGTFYKPGEPLWRKLEPGLAGIFDDALALALSREWVPALEAFDEALRARGKDPVDPGLRPLRLNAFAIHEQVRSHRRFALLKALSKARLPVQVYGSGYDRDLYRFKTVEHKGQASIDEISALMRRSRLVLNVNANFGAGSHERPLTAMMAGAVAVTDESAFYRERFGADEIADYRWLHLDEDLAALGDLLEDGQRMLDIAIAGQKAALAGHRWRDRLPAILAAAAAVSG